MHGSFWQFSISGGLVVADPEAEGLYILNHSAAFIWREFGIDADADRVASRFASAFCVSGEIAGRDVRGALAAWEEMRGALRRAARTDGKPAPGQPSATHVVVGGRRLRVEFDSAELAADVLPRIAHLRDEADLSAGVDFTVRPAARALMLQEMVRLARGKGEWLALLHAGACATEAGCVVFPAPSGSGKTTLAAALMGSGLRCHADDSVGIERDLLIPPMPFALAVREGSWPVVGARREGFEALEVVERFGQKVRFAAPGPQSGAVPATALVFPRYEPGAETEASPLEALETLLALKEAGFWVEHRQETIQAFLDWVVGLPSYRLVYSDVDAAAAFFERLTGCGVGVDFDIVPAV